MIQFSKSQLANGLTVITHEDLNTPFVVLNVLYKVGARNEHADRTGFAHLFEHLMFEGSANAPNFDIPIERAGGNNNAFTNNDYTSYYNIAPAENLETLCWLESDRMLALDINQHALDVQKKVVVEEFKENYINRPYGNVWHEISDLSYTTHPYRWPTIGKETSHVETAELTEVKAFFDAWYRPNNAIVVVSGNVKEDAALEMVNKWFGDIPSSPTPDRSIPKEPRQEEARKRTVTADVPVTRIYKSYHMSDRAANEFYPADLITDLLSMGSSSRLYRSLVRDQQLFSAAEAYVTGFHDEGLIVVEGALAPGVSMEEAEQAIDTELGKVMDGDVRPRELEKVKNKLETLEASERTKLLPRTLALSYFEMLGDVNMINTELEKYRNVSLDEITSQAKEIFRPGNCSTLYYQAN
jgi:predicted Zn-dependent peptidase